VPRALTVFRRPLQLLWNCGNGTHPDVIQVRAPVGSINIALRNFESLKTCFSIFARNDYRTDPDHRFLVLDIGANIGIAALYFLSRNTDNKVRCYEPDPTNLDYLRWNLSPFGARAEIIGKAVAPSGGRGTLFRAVDGKHSSLLKDVAISNGFAAESTTELVAFDDVLRNIGETNEDVLVKLDVEGIEAALVQSVDFCEYPQLRRMLVESTTCSSLIRRPHHRTLRTGSIEDIEFSRERP
jgi:FkbM family methyltransferase